LPISDFQRDQFKTLAVNVPADAIQQFVKLSGDAAPLHTDAVFAKNAGFEAPVVHGAYLTALVSRFVGMEFPGANAILERMDIMFRRPCYAPAHLTIKGTVVQVSEAVATVVLQISVTQADGSLIASGKTWHRIL
jgi:3-hydroxybutyryl-CoA dehydratase